MASVLVVDDEVDIRDAVSELLADEGYVVQTAGDGAEALRKARDLHPSLVLLDLMMPGMNGWQVIEALILAPETAGIPVILQTTAEDLESFEKARRRGVAAFISKPFRLNEVIETCRRILEGARPLQGRSSLEHEGPAVWLREQDVRWRWLVILLLPRKRLR